MGTNLYTATIPPMVKTLQALSGILDKADYMGVVPFNKIS